jgi:hypothetical protein
MGFTLGFLFLLLQGRFLVSSVPFGVFLLLFPMPFDLATKGKLRESNRYIRFATGLMFGFGVAPYLGISISAPTFIFEPYMFFVLLLTSLLLFVQKVYERSATLAKGFITLVNSTSFAAIPILPFLIIAWFFRMILIPYIT